MNAIVALRLPKTEWGIIGLGAMREYIVKPARPASPRISGTSVCHELHGNITPPQVRGIRKEDVLAMKRPVPK